MNLTKDHPARQGAFDIFTYHQYCNGMTPIQCGARQVATVANLRKVLPEGMPIYLEETGSSAGCYNEFHDTTGEAAFVVPYVAAMQQANLSGAHWWCASDLYTEHGCPPTDAEGVQKPFVRRYKHKIAVDVLSSGASVIVLSDRSLKRISMDPTRKLLWWDAPAGIHWAVGVHHSLEHPKAYPSCLCHAARCGNSTAGHNNRTRWHVREYDDSRRARQHDQSRG